jgi:shikimate kinase
MLVKGFKQFNEEKTKSVTFTFGRFNPPTIGHEKLITQVIKIARGGDYKIFVSQSNNPKSDPLQYKEKVGIMRKMFPKYARNIILDAKLKTVFDISVSLYKQGYNDVTMVIGSDRIKEFKTLLLKYNGTKARHGFYEFDNISFESAGERDPDSDDVSGMSASKMRAAAVSGDFQAFADGLPKSFGDKLSVFNLLRKRMGLKEMSNFRKHIQLPTVSEKRESYIAGEIFNKGDKVYCQKSNAYFTIAERYSNYVVSVIGTKYFINDLEEYLDENVKYHAGLSKSTKDKRKAQFKKQAKMDDDNPAAYKPAPGDATAKTKPSKYTTKFKDMFGEDDEPCWDTHKQVGLKKKNGKMVPNCVPKEGTIPMFRDMFVEDKNPIVDTEDNVEEGVDDPAIFKSVFLAGGPGSGKSFTVGKTGLAAIGFKIVNSDDKFEAALKKADLEPTPDNIFSPKGQKLRGRAKELTAKQQELYINGRLGLVVDGTGKNYAKIKTQAEALKKIGYDIAMIFVNTDLETALKRNRERARSLTDKKVEEMWKEVQSNLGKFQSFFGSNFIIVDNSEGSNIEKATTAAYKKILKFSKQDPKNSIAKKWIAKQLGEERIPLIAENKKGIQNKADKTGISYSILKKVFDRGVAAWRTGHRPGTTPSQWGFARINSFATGGKTRTTADKDLWAQHKGKKKEALEYGTTKGTNAYKKDTPGQSIEEGEGKYKGETWEQGYKRRVVKTSDPDHLEKGYKWRIKGKERPEISIKLYKEKPDFKEYSKQMQRVAGHEFGK